MRRDNKQMLREVESLADLKAVMAACEERCAAPHSFIAARYPSRCYLCTEAIVIGDSIAWKRGFPAVHGSCHRAALAPKESAA